MKLLNSCTRFTVAIWFKIFVMIMLLTAGQTIFGQSSTIPAATADEKEAVRQAVLDYVEGIYNVEPARVERSVHPDLIKRGFNKKKGETNNSLEPMTFQELVEISKTFNKSGRLPKDARKEVEVYDVLDRIASAKLTAMWGVDYMLLIKDEGKWKIIQVLWKGRN